jgi:methylase of polypeptide subunit release factors
VSEDQDQALRELLNYARARDYAFVTPTPATHGRVYARLPGRSDLRSILGWSLPFDHSDDADPTLVDLLTRAHALDENGRIFTSRVRVSSLGDLLLLHSAYPTTQQDAVFFGPDSYRFARFLQAELPRIGARTHLVDIGAGTGVGAMVVAQTVAIKRITLTDINPQALRFARINADFAGIAVDTVLSDALGAVSGDIDCIIANPPYIADPARRAYRDGGSLHGGEVSLAWTEAATQRLGPGGAFLLYTGSAIINGKDKLKAALLAALSGFDVSYRELDPDVFGEELDQPAYADADRIAAVGLVAIKR